MPKTASSIRADANRTEPEWAHLIFRGSRAFDRQPLAAFEDEAFAREAKDLVSTTFLAHVRFASTGSVKFSNTHPFCQGGRLFAHNGALADLPRLDAELGEYRSLVVGDTDSERLFALITKHIDLHDGDVGGGIASAIRWVPSVLPVLALNLIVTTPSELWALRYPETNDLLVLERRGGGHHGTRQLEHSSTAGAIRVRSDHLASTASVVVATEAMDEDPGWRHLRPGELLHVDGQLGAHSEVIIDRPPDRLLTVDDLRRPARARAVPTTPDLPPTQ